jgi:plasmid stability protein
MKATLDLPDDLMRAIKARAAQEDRKLKDLMADLLRRGLAGKTGGPVPPGKRVRFPLIECESAPPGEELTPERLAEILIDQEASAAIEIMQRPVR